MVHYRGDLTNRKVSTHSNDSISSDHHPSREGSPNLNSPRRSMYDLLLLVAFLANRNRWSSFIVYSLPIFA